jgi:hypothetical protein
MYQLNAVLTLKDSNGNFVEETMSFGTFKRVKDIPNYEEFIKDLGGIDNIFLLSNHYVNGWEPKEIRFTYKKIKK